VVADAYGADMPSVPNLRVARPSEDLEALIPFYRDGLGLNVLFRFENHEGFDGIMFGSEDAPYHFEFTRANGHAVGRAPAQDHAGLLSADAEKWQVAIDRMRSAGFAPVPAFSPYWHRCGRTFEDPDRYRIVLQQAAWNGS
jgi:catechol 2,3-dioxygenase-like lactoylglutathione lyase family enzyme